MKTDKHEIEKSYHVVGIDCPGCADVVKKEILKINGIKKAEYDFENSKLTLKISDETTQKDFEKTINKLGLQIHKEGSRRTSTFYVEGMDCSNEERIIRQELQKIEGIDSLSFDLINHRLTIIHHTNEGKLIKALTSLGFSPETYPNKIHQQTKNRRKKISQVVFIIISGLLAFTGMLFENLDFAENVSIVFFLLSIIFGGLKVFHKAYLSLKKFIIDINVLMSIAVAGALLIDYYLEAAIVMFLYVISLKLESFSIEKAKSAIHNLISLVPQTSFVKKGNDYVEILTEDIQVGDKILVKPGEKIPIDGIVVDGSSFVNQSPITGESKLIAKVKGDPCYAGTINQKGTLLIEATSTFKDSQFSKIISLLKNATTESRSNLQRVVDVFASYYTPVVILIAFIMTLVSHFIMNQPLNDAIYKGLVLLVISCPCALVISTPVAVVSSLAKASKLGALVKGGIFMENLHKVDAFVFDKTGTLTEGNLKVKKIISLNSYPEEQLLQIAYALEIRSEHSIADAIVDYAKNKNIELYEVDDFKVNDGSITGIYNGKKYSIGQPRIFLSNLNEFQKQIIEQLEQSGYTVILISEENKPIAIIALIDNLRESMKSTIQELRTEGVKSFYILSGDTKNIVEKVASEVGINEYYGELKPDDKLNLVKDLKSKHKILAMIGDGLNDAPALKAASIGIAMGRIGTDATIENSDITLIGDETSKLPKLFRLSRKTTQVIKQNIILSIGIKAIFIVLAFLNLATMWGAIFADMGSSLIVIFNSLKLLKARI